jgi:hypothetical protein
MAETPEAWELFLSCADPMSSLGFLLDRLVLHLVFDSENCLQIPALKPSRKAWTWNIAVSTGYGLPHVYERNVFGFVAEGY